MNDSVQPRPVRHHTVPKFYLRRFADNEGFTMRIELPGTRRGRTSIRSATVYDDFYTIELPDGSLSDQLERALGEVENLAAPALARLVEGDPWPPSAEDRFAISQWASAQHLRTPAVRQGMDEVRNSMARLEIGAGGKEHLRARMEADYGRSVCDEELQFNWDRYTRPGGPGFVTTATGHLQTMLDLMDGTTRYFFHRAWTLMRSKHPVVATSDTPVTLIPDLSEVGGFYNGIGLANARHILIPLDRRTMLVLDEVGQPDAEVPATPDVVRYLMTMLAQFGHRALFHHPDDDPLQGIALPAPREHEIRVSNMDGLIAEEGIFHRREPKSGEEAGRPDES